MFFWGDFLMPVGSVQQYNQKNKESKNQTNKQWIYCKNK
jgi:hypothetical protein